MLKLAFLAFFGAVAGVGDLFSRARRSNIYGLLAARVKSVEDAELRFLGSVWRRPAAFTATSRISILERHRDARCLPPRAQPNSPSTETISARADRCQLVRR